jgi:RNA polymerase sigma factor (sigma-70 family)
MRRQTSAGLRTTEEAVSRTDVPGLAEAAVATEPAQALSAAIDRVYPELRKTVEILVFKAGLARHADEVTEVAGEVLAEAVARAMERADRWRPETSPRPWIARFAVNVIHERRRQAGQDRRHVVRVAGPAVDQNGLLGSVPDPASLGSDRLVELLDLVAEPERTLLRRAYLDHQPQAEIAESLALNGGTLRVRLLRARQRFITAYLAAERGEKGGRP